MANHKEQGNFQLNGTTTNSADYVTGVGTVLGVQTVYGLDGSLGGTNYCATGANPSLSSIFTYAAKNGSQFIEATEDIAFTSACQPYLASSLPSLTSNSAVNCLY